MVLPQYPQIDVEDYLLLDRSSKEQRYEYFDGELRMQAGGSTYHSRIIANLTGVIYGALGDSPCNIYNSDVRLQLSETCYVHPDLAVSCDSHDEEQDDMIYSPRLVVEVLSPSTEATDRGEKFLYYRECSTIEEYVMADSQSILIEVYRREGDGWKLHAFGPGSTVRLESIDVEFSIDTIYRRMKLTEKRKNKKQK